MEDLQNDPKRVMLAALVFSFLQPVTKLINKKMQGALANLWTMHGFINWTDFLRSDSDQRKTKDVAISSSQAKIVRVN